MNKNARNIILIIVVALGLPMLASGAYKKIDSGAVSRNLQLFNSLFKELNAYYVDTINVQKSIEGAIKGMLRDVDPYTEYIPQSERADFEAVATGEYGGIGSYIQQRDSAVYISEPQFDSPAAKAGLKAGDKILQIDTINTLGLASDKVSKLLRGQPKTKVQVKVLRPYDADSIKTFTIVREKINVRPVPYYGVANGNLGFISISTFNEKTGSAVKDALVDLKTKPEVKAIVLDLRGNSGGLLEQAVKVVGLFVPKGTEVLQTKGRQVQETKVYKTTQQPVDLNIPLYVLIDGGSASASEIVAGSLQDLDRAVVIGARSFGKGLVQTTRPLPSGAMLKVTIAKYYIPSGRLIQEIDYSNRDGSGNAKQVPDSLTKVFHTAHGREVRDGGGIKPDIEVKFDKVNRLTYNIVYDHWAFDYVTKFVSKNPTVASPSEFEITDEIFEEFKASINPEKFEYDKVCEAGLDELKKVAENEGYANDSVKAQFEVLAKLLKHDLNHDLDHNKEAIKEILSMEVMRRYYYEPGLIENSLKTDECIKEVVKVMGEAGKYEAILNLNGKKK